MPSQSVTRLSFVATIKQAIAAACAAVFFLFATTGLAMAEGNAAVRVTGQGESLFEARQDAIRQALQISTDQLIIDQRVVENDKLVLEKISSTMNGFVNDFKTVRVSESEGGFIVEADIEISPTRIQNFIGGSSSAGVEIDSQNILAAVQQEKLARRARSEVLIALFRELEFALIASPPKVSVNKSNPEKVDFVYEVSINPDFIKMLGNGLKQLSAYQPSADDVSRDATLTICLGDNDSLIHDRYDWRSAVQCFFLHGLDKSIIEIRGGEAWYYEKEIVVSAALVGYQNGVPVRLLSSFELKHYGLSVPEAKGYFFRTPESGSDPSKDALLLYTGEVVFQETINAASLENISLVKAFPFLMEHEDSLGARFFFSDIITGEGYRYEDILQGPGFSYKNYFINADVFWELFAKTILKIPIE